jgi:hypothetical protein
VILDRRSSAALRCWSRVGYHLTPLFYRHARVRCWQPANKGPQPPIPSLQHSLWQPTRVKDVLTSPSCSLPTEPPACALRATHHPNHFTPCVASAHPSAMPSTSYTRPVSRAATALLLLSAAFISSTSAANLRTMKSAGCYSSSTPLKDQGSNIYQSSGACQPICVDQDFAVMAMTEGSNCLCGDMLPSEDSKVSDDKCDTPCDGYDKEMCTSSNPPCRRFTRTLLTFNQAVDTTTSASSSAAPRTMSTAMLATHQALARVQLRQAQRPLLQPQMLPTVQQSPQASHQGPQ